jgi:uncharacterized protein YfaT (DUF1175 family)
MSSFARTLRSRFLHFTVAALVCALAPRAVHAQSERPFEQWSTSALGLRDSIVSVARAQLGTPYVLGGNDPNAGFDCSGLVRYVMAALELETPRTAKQQATVGSAVVKDPKQLRPGDLLTFTAGKGVVSHVGIYVGDGRYIHASSKAGRVIESQITRTTTALVTIWQGARRLMALVDPDEGTAWKLAPRKSSVASSAARRPQSVVVRRDPAAVLRAALTGVTFRVSPKNSFAGQPFSFLLHSQPQPVRKARQGVDLVQLMAYAAPQTQSLTPSRPFAESRADLANRR